MALYLKSKRYISSQFYFTEVLLLSKVEKHRSYLSFVLQMHFGTLNNVHSHAFQRFKAAPTYASPGLFVSR